VRNIIFSATALLLIQGCAGFKSTRVLPDDYKTKGLPFYTSMPYLQVTEPVVIAEYFTGHAAVSDGAPAPKVQAQDSSSKSTTKKSGSPPAGDPTKASTPAKPSASKGKAGTNATQKSPVSVVYLPDYCSAHRLHSWSFLSKQKLEAKFTDGWKLDGIDFEADSTEVATTLIKSLEAIATAAITKDTGADDDEEAEAEGEAVEEQSASAGQKHLVVLLPGVYPLFERPDNNCDKAPTFVGTSSKISTYLSYFPNLPSNTATTQP